ncbi:Holliday junction resolvase RuvX [Candidatus Walczuchella endosymbiont of Icerya purchasi]|uniref:Holliday junction resolvase RuvX n=1 Tax=Candidatus Walczuchella endosymbiont of Icerya purchasi TaxID=3066219 RepID=UPI00313E7A70
MSRILAIDYGKKRTGLAVTDPFGMIAFGLKTVKTSELMIFLNSYLSKERVKTLIVGDPKNQYFDIEKDIQTFIKNFLSIFYEIPVVRVDERFTSKIAKDSITYIKLKKKYRKNKALIDEISAVLILQDYLG